jgi:hypothetical protein
MCLAPWLGGCRAVDNAQVDVLERELRQKEDYIYELEDYLIEYSEKLRQCRVARQAPAVISTKPRSTQAASEPTLADDAPRSATPRPLERGAAQAEELETLPEPAIPPATDEPADELPPSGPADEPDSAPTNPEEMEAPDLEIGPTSNLPWQDATPIADAAPTFLTDPGNGGPSFIPDPAEYQVDVDSPVDSDAEPLVAQASDGAAELDVASGPESLDLGEPTLPPLAEGERLVAERLEIRRLFSQPATADAGSPSALLVVVEALNATDEPVDAVGAISLMVMAGESAESLKPINRWDFTADETKAAWQSSQLGDGLHLELPLDRGDLPAGPLELWARLVNADGEKLLAQLPFETSDLAPLASAAPELSPAPGDGGQALSAADAVDGETESTAGTPVAEAASPAWRASSRPLRGARVEGFASTAGGTTGKWTSRAPGSLAPSVGAPRVAAHEADHPGRRQDSPASPPGQGGKGDSAWNPFRR